MFFGVVLSVLSSFEINLPRNRDLISFLHCNLAVTWLSQAVLCFFSRCCGSVCNCVIKGDDNPYDYYVI